MSGKRVGWARATYCVKRASNESRRLIEGAGVPIYAKRTGGARAGREKRKNKPRRSERGLLSTHGLENFGNIHDVISEKSLYAE